MISLKSNVHKAVYRVFYIRYYTGTTAMSVIISDIKQRMSLQSYNRLIFIRLDADTTIQLHNSTTLKFSISHMQ